MRENLPRLLITMLISLMTLPTSSAASNNNHHSGGKCLYSAQLNCSAESRCCNVEICCEPTTALTNATACARECTGPETTGGSCCSPGYCCVLARFAAGSYNPFVLIFVPGLALLGMCLHYGVRHAPVGHIRQPEGAETAQQPTLVHVKGRPSIITPFGRVRLVASSSTMLLGKKKPPPRVSESYPTARWSALTTVVSSGQLLNLHPVDGAVH